MSNTVVSPSITAASPANVSVVATTPLPAVLLNRVRRVLDGFVEADETTAITAAVATPDAIFQPLAAGVVASHGRPVDPGDRFLVASLTKPIVASACLLMASRGQLTLGDRVVDWLPEFSGGERRPITIRHLLTHTSGLAEVWPNNIELRQAHAGLQEFVASGCSMPLDSRPAALARYSSVGYSLLGAILERVDGRPLRQILHEEVFQPLGMSQTSLGLEEGHAEANDLVEIRLPSEQQGTDWHWNSSYWRRLGAPWGGLVSTAEDLITYLRAFAGWSDSSLFATSVRDASWTNQLPELGIATENASSRGWGLGWRFNWPGHAAALCELLPVDVVGHYGATGTLMWVSRDRCAVVLTSEPALKRPRLLQRISNIMASLESPLVLSEKCG